MSAQKEQMTQEFANFVDDNDLLNKVFDISVLKKGQQEFSKTMSAMVTKNFYWDAKCYDEEKFLV